MPHPSIPPAAAPWGAGDPRPSAPPAAGPGHDLTRSSMDLSGSTTDPGTGLTTSSFLNTTRGSPATQEQGGRDEPIRDLNLASSTQLPSWARKAAAAAGAEGGAERAAHSSTAGVVAGAAAAGERLGWATAASQAQANMDRLLAVLRSQEQELEQELSTGSSTWAPREGGASVTSTPAGGWGAE